MELRENVAKQTGAAGLEGKSLVRKLRGAAECPHVNVENVMGWNLLKLGLKDLEDVCFSCATPPVEDLIVSIAELGQDAGIHKRSEDLLLILLLFRALQNA